MKRRVTYVTGTRADFGLMLPTLRALQATEGLSVELFVTGTHLSRRFGHTIDEVRESGLPIASTLPVALDDDTPSAMATAAAHVALGTSSFMAANPPDVCLLLGDRWEMLAAAMSAVLQGVPIVHVCGGERSGSVDDMLRHAISKLAHVHCVATEGARRRLLAMGEPEDRIHVVGAPGLVGIHDFATRHRVDWAGEHDLDPDRPIALVLFHPVVQQASVSGDQMRNLLSAVEREGLQALCLLPNADRGHAGVRDAVLAACAASTARAVPHLRRADFLSVLAGADVMVGNSSSGIVEAASFGTPVVNVGDRQIGRERNANTIDCDTDSASIADALRLALRRGRMPPSNLYGDGRADRRIRDVVAGLAPPATLLKKTLTY